MNDFYEDLQYSYEVESFWDSFYKKAFVDLERTELCNDLTLQRKGVDRFVYLKSGHVLTIDEKSRRKAYPDIALEFLSNDKTGSPGWINKQLVIDYLAYAFIPTGDVYLFPWEMLRRAWVEFGEIWKMTYGVIEAHNPDYNTLSVPVPIKVLRATVSTAAIIKIRP